jgi:hypothetical protein
MAGSSLLLWIERKDLQQTRALQQPVVCGLREPEIEVEG